MEENVRDITPALFEKLMIFYLFNDEKVQDRLLSYLNPLIFNDTDVAKLVKDITDFMTKYSRFPKVNELKIFIKNSDTYNFLINEILTINSSDYDRDFILSELEEYYRKCLLKVSLTEVVSELSQKTTDNFTNVPDKIREALSFTFQENIGWSLLEDKERYYEAIHNKELVIPTGILKFDDNIEGGFHKKTLNLFMAKSGSGKSLIMCSLGTSFIEQNKKVLYITLEMSEQKIMDRLIANIFNIDTRDIKNLSRENFDKFYDALIKKIKTDIKIIQYPARTMSANKIRNILKELKIKKKFEPDVLILDYLQLCTTNNPNRNINTAEQLKIITEEVRAVAIEQDLPIVSAIQTNREGFKGTDIDLTQVSESIAIVFGCDIVVGVYSDDALKSVNKYKWTLLKNRYGIQDYGLYVGVDYPRMRIYNLEEENMEMIRKDVNAAVNIMNDVSIDNKNSRTSKFSELE